MLDGYVLLNQAFVLLCVESDFMFGWMIKTGL